MPVRVIRFMGISSKSVVQSGAAPLEGPDRMLLCGAAISSRRAGHCNRERDKKPTVEAEHARQDSNL
jgi:hypothetical protein